MKIALFNDTMTTAHVGCLAVGNGHNRMLSDAQAQVAYRFYVGQFHQPLGHLSRSEAAAWLEASFLHNVLLDVDAVVVNGEGTIHHGAGHDLLAILDYAQRLGKKTILVNCVMQDLKDYFDTLARLDDLTCREPRTLAYLKAHEIPARLVPDSILAAQFDLDLEDNRYAGKIIVTDFHPLRAADVGKQLAALLKREDAVYFPLESPERYKDWRQTISLWSKAKVVITGRHHGVYLSVLAGTPCIALGSNTWKVEGTLEMLEMETGITVPFHHDAQITDAQIEAAAARRPDFLRLREHLKGQLPLTTFDSLKAQPDVSCGQRIDALDEPIDEPGVGDEPLANGVVLVIHTEHDKAITGDFWCHSSAQLAQRGYLLIVASTVPLTLEGVSAIEIPAEVPEFLTLYPYARSTSQLSSDKTFLNAVMQSHACDRDAAKRAGATAEAFLADLLDALRPAAILNGPRQALMAELLDRVARARKVPAWFVEYDHDQPRLMLDSLSIGTQSELPRLDSMRISLVDAEKEASATALAEHLCQFERPADARLPDRIERFLSTWAV